MCLSFRAPSRPLECYHGSCYSESVEVNREDGVVNGVKLSLIADGKSDALSSASLSPFFLFFFSDSHHSKTRLREFEKVVRFGDTVQVSACCLAFEWLRLCIDILSAKLVPSI